MIAIFLHNVHRSRRERKNRAIVSRVGGKDFHPAELSFFVLFKKKEARPRERHGACLLCVHTSAKVSMIELLARETIVMDLTIVKSAIECSFAEPLLSVYASLISDNSYKWVVSPFISE